MSGRTVLERRAATVLYHYLRSVTRRGKWLLPANVCPVVPAVFSKANIAYEFVDIDSQTLCMDFDPVLSRLRSATKDYAGLLFVRTYGHCGDFEPFFLDVKQIDPCLRVIDDRCQGRPCFIHSGGVADLELYSTGYAKLAELGWGGWGLLLNDMEYQPTKMPFEESAHERLVAYFRKVLWEHVDFECPNTPWLDMRDPHVSLPEFRSLVEKRIQQSSGHRAILNSIYSEQLEEWAAPAELLNWRFTIFCNNPTDLIRSIFKAGHFASAHFASLVPMFGSGFTPVADLRGRQVVNLFNDFRYDADRAAQLATLVLHALRLNSLTEVAGS